MNYQVKRSGQWIGELSEEAIRGMLSRGELSAEDVARRDGTLDWAPLGSLFPDAVAGPGPQQSAPPSQGLEPGVATADPSLASEPPPLPNNNLVGAILTTLCCCLPFGIVSIVYAAQVNAKYSGGDYRGAEESAAKSKTWMWWGFGIGLAINAIYLIVVLAGVAGSASL